MSQRFHAFRAIGFGIVLLGLSVQARAGQTVTATFDGFSPTNYPLVQRTLLEPYGNTTPTYDVRTVDPGRFTFTRTGGTYTGGLVGSSSNQFFGFCGEPLEFVSQGSSYTWNLMPLKYDANNIGTIGEAKAAEIDELFGRYFPRFNAALTATQAAALQISVWEIVREQPGAALDIFSGWASFSGTDPSLALAESYVQSLNGKGPSLTNLMTLTVNGAQDMIVQVVTTPEPATLGMIAIGGLVAIGFIHSRSRLARDTLTPIVINNRS